MMVAAIATFLTGVSTQWYQPSLEPYVRNTFGLSSFQVSYFVISDAFDVSSMQCYIIIYVTFFIA